MLSILQNRSHNCFKLEDFECILTCRSAEESELDIDSRGSFLLHFGHGEQQAGWES